MGSAAALVPSSLPLSLEITMKFLLLICLVGLASAKYTETLKQFDDEMGIVENAPEEVEKMEEELLEKTEKEINENNEKFAKGESSFEEKLTEFADMTDDELKEHEGAIAGQADHPCLLQLDNRRSGDVAKESGSVRILRCLRCHRPSRDVHGQGRSHAQWSGLVRAILGGLRLQHKWCQWVQWSMASHLLKVVP